MSLITTTVIARVGHAEIIRRECGAVPGSALPGISYSWRFAGDAPPHQKAFPPDFAEFGSARDDAARRQAEYLL